MCQHSAAQVLFTVDLHTLSLVQDTSPKPFISLHLFFIHVRSHRVIWWTESMKWFIPSAWEAILLTYSATINHSQALKWNTSCPQSHLTHIQTQTWTRTHIHTPRKALTLVFLLLLFFQKKIRWGQARMSIFHILHFQSEYPMQLSMITKFIINCVFHDVSDNMLMWFFTSSCSEQMAPFTLLSTSSVIISWCQKPPAAPRSPV